MFSSRWRLFSLYCARCVCSLAWPSVPLCSVWCACTLGVCPYARVECRRAVGVCVVYRPRAIYVAIGGRPGRPAVP